MTKKLANGNIDTGKLTDGVAERSADVQEYDEQEEEFCLFSDVYADFLTSLHGHGYRLLPAPGGMYGCHKLYKQATTIGIKGMQTEPNFYFWKEVKVNNKAEKMLFRNVVMSILDDKQGSVSKGEYSHYKSLVKGLLDTPSNIKSAFATQALNVIVADGAEDELIRTLTGKPTAFKVVPQTRWFSPKLQTLDARSLITLLADAEARQLMLILGRAVIGSRGARALEGEIDHTFRSFGVMVSKGGLGKSTLLENIIDTLGLFGFKTASVAQTATRFGWAEAALADFSYFDDLVEDTQAKLFKSSDVKSLVSNGNIRVEEKGIAHYTVKARTALLGATNTAQYSQYIGMDDGCISRLNQLQGYSPQELVREHPGIDPERIRTKEYWEDLAKVYDCDRFTLTAYLLARSAEYFLEVSGLRVENGLLVKHQHLNVLEKVVKDNRANFRFDTGLRHAEELTEAASHLIAISLANAKENDRKKLLPALSSLTFGSDNVFALCEVFLNSESIPPWADKILLKHASTGIKRFLADKKNGLETLSKTMSYDESFSKLVKELTSTKGFGYPTKVSHYTADWNEHLREIPTLVEHYRECLGDLALPNTFEGILEGVLKNLKRY